MIPSCDPHAWVLADVFRAHVRRLVADTGLPWRAVAVAADVSPAVVHTLLFGRHGHKRAKIPRSEAERLYCLSTTRIRQATFQLVHAGQTRQHIAQLLTAGFTIETVATFLDTSTHEVNDIVLGTRRRCAETTSWRAAAATAAHDLVWDVVVPQPVALAA